MIILLAYNPSAGNFRRPMLAEFASALAAKGYEVRQCDCHDAAMIALARDCDHICVIGGDGSLSDVVTALAPVSEGKTFSQFPLGTINLVAREANYPAQINSMVERISNANDPDAYFVGRSAERSFLACASIGPDARAVAQVSSGLKKRIGRLAYAAAFLQILLDWKRQRIVVQANGQQFEAEAAYILKGRFFAGPWQLSPTANLKNPQFSLLLLPTARRRDYLRLVASAILHPGFADPRWTYLQCSMVQITSPGPTALQIDGDMGGNLPALLTVHPKPLNFA